MAWLDFISDFFWAGARKGLTENTDKLTARLDNGLVQLAPVANAAGTTLEQAGEAAAKVGEAAQNSAATLDKVGEAAGPTIQAVGSAFDVATFALGFNAFNSALAVVNSAVQIVTGDTDSAKLAEGVASLKNISNASESLVLYNYAKEFPKIVKNMLQMCSDDLMKEKENHKSFYIFICDLSGSSNIWHGAFHNSNEKNPTKGYCGLHTDLQGLLHIIHEVRCSKKSTDYTPILMPDAPIVILLPCLDLLPGSRPLQITPAMLPLRMYGLTNMKGEPIVHIRTYGARLSQIRDLRCDHITNYAASLAQRRAVEQEACPWSDLAFVGASTAIGGGALCLSCTILAVLGPAIGTVGLFVTVAGLVGDWMERDTNGKSGKRNIKLE